MKRFMQAVLRIAGACILLAAVVFAAIALYMRLYGNAHLKQLLTGLIGAKVNFSAVALDLDRQTVNFKEFSIASEIGFEKHIFSADTFTVYLNKEKLEKEKRMVFDRVYIKGAKIFVIRDKAGKLNLALPSAELPAGSGPVVDEAPAPQAGGAAPSAAPAPAPAPRNGFFTVLQAVKQITIEDSFVSFEDQYGMKQPYRIWCDRFFADLVSQDTNAGYMGATLTAKCRLPQKRYGDGWLGMRASMAAYPDRTNMEATASAGNVDILIFAPYFARNTPFLFRSGRFSSKSDLRLHDGVVDSLTTMSFDDLQLFINPYAPNAQFLHVSINRLAPYLTSGGNIVFDFVMKGDARRPQFGVGPRVKFAIGMVVMEEVGKAIAAMQQ